MRYFSRSTTWSIFAVAVLILIGLAVATGRTTASYASIEHWVSHTQEVETAIARVRGDLFAAETTRLDYLLTGDEKFSEDCEKQIEQLQIRFGNLRDLTVDNEMQQQRVDEVRPLVDQEIADLRDSLKLHRDQAGRDQQQQLAMTTTLANLSTDSVASLRVMRDDEEKLLQERRTLAQSRYTRIRLLLVIAFSLVVGMIFELFRRLMVELGERATAEASVTRLSGRILQVQDEERRKVARELHDGIGQVFAGLKMNVRRLLAMDPREIEKQRAILQECSDMLEQGVKETRTLSHLLHPPLLDEIGFGAAAKWLVEGFSERSAITVKLDISDAIERMPQEVELVLFRVLQESLTNIHRHSGSKTATISIEHAPERVTLRIQDFGKGMPEAVLQRFKSSSAGMGVGLAGMRERVRELGGEFDLRSDGPGTELIVSIPLGRFHPIQQGASGPQIPENGATTEVSSDGRPLNSSLMSSGLILSSDTAY